MERLTYKIKQILEPTYKSNIGVEDFECIDKLGKYEDLEEQGLFLKLPCKIGTTVFVIPTIENSFKGIAEMICLGYSIGEPSNNANLFSTNRSNKDVPKMYQPSIEDFGKTWFVTKEEAELKLEVLTF